MTKTFTPTNERPSGHIGHKQNHLPKNTNLERMLNRLFLHHGVAATTAVEDDKCRTSERGRNECAVRHNSWRPRTRSKSEPESNSKLNLYFFVRCGSRSWVRGWKYALIPPRAWDFNSSAPVSSLLQLQHSESGLHAPVCIGRSDQRSVPVILPYWLQV